MMKPAITGKDNPQVRRVSAYQNKKKERDRDGVFVAEGERLVAEVPKDALVTLYVTASYRDGATGDAKRFLDAHEDRTELVSDDVMRKMSDVETPQGILAVVRQRKEMAVAPSDESDSLCRAGHSAEPVGPGFMGQKPLTGKHADDRPCILLLDNIQDTGNLGTILRSSEAAGATAVWLTNDCVDIYHPKVVRATMGAIYRVPFVRLGHAASLSDVIASLKQRGITVYAADMGGTIAYDQADLTAPACFLIGNEANGLSEEARRGADVFLRIPMAGKAESLNAAVAASVLLFETARQRRNSGK